MTEIVKGFLELHVALAPVLFIFFRTLSILFPPFPGTTLDLIAIPLFGKFWGFVYAETTMVIGGAIAFLIARKLGKPFVEKFMSVKKIEEWEEKIEERSGFWGLTTVRMISISIFDYVSYIAGLTKINFGKYMLSSLIASIPPTAFFYYIGGFILEMNLGIITFLVPIVFGIILIRDKIVTQKMRNGISRFFNGSVERLK